jgi:hypothetical protein
MNLLFGNLSLQTFIISFILMMHLLHSSDLNVAVYSSVTYSLHL